VAYRVETERTVLRCWSPEDAPRVRASLDRSDAHLRPWIPFMKEEPRSLEETVEWLRRRRAWFDSDEHHCYAVTARGSGELLGEAMLLDRAGPDALEIGYWIDVEHVGRGLATEAAAALTRVAFELAGVERVELGCAPENAASAAIPARLGFAHEATLAGRFLDTEGVRRDLMVWTLWRADYPAAPARLRPVRAYDALGRVLLVEGAGG